MKRNFNIAINCYNNHSDFVNFEANITISILDSDIKIIFPVHDNIIFIGLQPNIEEKKAIISDLFLLFSESATQLLKKYNYGGIVSFISIKYSYMDSKLSLYKGNFIRLLEEKLNASQQRMLKK